MTFETGDRVSANWWTDPSSGEPTRHDIWFPGVVEAVDEASGVIEVLYDDKVRETVPRANVKPRYDPASGIDPDKEVRAPIDSTANQPVNQSLSHCVQYTVALNHQTARHWMTRSPNHLVRCP